METPSRYCSLDAQSIMHDIIGSIEYRPHQIFLEVPEPWDRTFSLSQHFPAHLAVVLKTLAKKGSLVSTSLFAPDPTYSQAGGWRLLYLRAKPEALRYETFEFVIPPEKIAALVEQIVSAPDPLDASFADYRVASQASRDYFICTHFRRDRCCGVFGNALYEKLRKDPLIQKHKIRIFRSSHIGGHRYAPTLLESPTLNCWGLLDAVRAQQIILREGPIENVIDHYRGSALFDSPFFQVAEREILRRQGWDWFQLEKRSFHGELHNEHGIVTVHCSPAKGPQRRYTVETYSTDPIRLRANCDDDETHAFPQYLLKSVESS